MNNKSPRAARLAGRSYNVYRAQGPRRRWPRVLLWLAIGTALVILFTGVGSYAWFRYQVAGANSRVDSKVWEVIKEKPSGKAAVDLGSPSAMNILVLGYDKRPTSKDPSTRSDTMMVIHVDPDSNYLSILSLPRDMWVTIPGHGKQRLNVAYADGGAALAADTLHTLGVPVDETLEVSFTAFQDITNALGGVYVDVDHRYWVPYGDLHQPINLQAGYQLLNGTDALSYVRYRDDQIGDIGRMQRQQRFLSAAREQIQGWDLLKLPGVINALFRNVATTLSADDIIKLSGWAAKLDGSRIRQVTVKDVESMWVYDSYGNHLNVLKVSDTTLANTIHQFLTPSSAAPSSSTSGSTATTAAKVQISGSSIDIIDKSGKSGLLSGAKQWMTALGVTVVKATQGSTTGLKTTKVAYPSGSKSLAQAFANAVGSQSVVLDSSVDRVTLVLGDDLAVPSQYGPQPSVDSILRKDLWDWRAKHAGFTVEAPTWLPSEYEYLYTYPYDHGTYNIKVDNGTKPAFKVVYVSKNVDLKKVVPADYLGIAETTWLDAPVASKPIYTRENNGVTYNVVGTYRQVDHIWWKKDGVLYWVSNTLQYQVSAGDLLKIAENMVALPKS